MRTNQVIRPRERDLIVPSRFRRNPMSRAFTQDGLMTFDAATLDSAGSFLIQELERLDPVMNMPLAVVTWQRDITPRVDVTMGDELASYTNSTFASAGGASPNGKSWIGKNSNTIARVQVDIGKTAQPLVLWGEQLSYTIPELASAVQTGRPLDSQMLEGLNLKLQMDIDEMVYIGDSPLGYTGLVNSAAITPVGAVTGTWLTATPDQIVGDIDAALYNSYAASSFAVFPRKILLPPAKMNYLVTKKVSDAGNISVLNYVKENSMAMAKYGVELDIQDCKWLIGAGAGATDRMVCYTNDPKYIRYPLVPTQSTPVERRGIDMITTYFGRLGVVEIRYGSTISYTDNI